MLEEEIDPQVFPVVIVGERGEMGGVGDRPDGDQVKGPETAGLLDFDRGDRTVAVDPEINEGLENVVGPGVDAAGKPVDRDFIPDAEEVIGVREFGQAVAESLPEPAARTGASGTDGQAGAAFPAPACPGGRPGRSGLPSRTRLGDGGPLFGGGFALRLVVDGVPKP